MVVANIQYDTSLIGGLAVNGILLMLAGALNS